VSVAWVLDSSAIVAWSRSEPGRERVERALSEGAAVSAVNWSEVLAKVIEKGESAEDTIADLTRRGILGALLHVHPLTEEGALDVARLRPLSRAAGLSLGDRACLALAGTLKLPVLTADRAWTKLHVGVKIENIR